MTKEVDSGSLLTVPWVLQELGRWKFDRSSTSPELSYVMCHASHVTCQLSRVTCHQEVKTVGWGSVINGATPSSLYVRNNLFEWLVGHALGYHQGLETYMVIWLSVRKLPVLARHYFPSHKWSPPVVPLWDLALPVCVSLVMFQTGRCISIRPCASLVNQLECTGKYWMLVTTGLSQLCHCETWLCQFVSP